MQSTVRAKFKCWSVIHGNDGNPDNICAEIRLQAAYGDGDEANKSWSKWTPSGELRMFVTNPSAIAEFEQGKSYYLDFTPAD